ncbi:hypothetical protein SUVC_04G4280 [Saccharomyces uvarum]|uniref:Hpc2-related domain-containing protein n=1 Tax=Saccharomyces uvarum TaxID=230603 RepID=A0AA35JHE0_SACUV|nr:hypothetical protein SUVC_04G4280 [Saccharomyces uvarum]
MDQKVIEDSKSDNEPSISSGEAQMQPDTRVQILNNDNNIKNEPEADSQDPLSNFLSKRTIKKIPNIAEELAKNRNHAKGASPSPILVSTSSSSAPPSGPPSSSTNSLDIPATNRFSRNTVEPFQYPPNSTVSTSKIDTDEIRRNSKNIDNRTAPERGRSSFAANQLKISSLLTMSSNDDSTPPAINAFIGNKYGSNTTNNIPSPSIELHTDANSIESLIKTPNSPRNKSLTPKVILPTQNMDGSLLKIPHLDNNTPGILIAKTGSPVNLDVETTVQPSAKINKPSTHSLKPALTKQPTEKVSLKRSNSSITHSDSNGNPNKKPAPERARKSNSVSAILPKPVSKTSKKASSSNADSNKKKPISNKTASAIKKEPNTSSKLSTVKKENSVPSSTKATEKEKDKNSNGTDAKNSANNVKKESTSKSPRKLVPAPTINSPKLVQTTETKIKEPSILIDIPLYQADTNDYLDENGQVIFNLSTLIKEKYHPNHKELAQLKDSKRNLITQLNDHSNGALEKEKDEEGDIILDDDEDLEDDEGELDTETNTAATTTSPKKKSHPMKGKNLIGKYDVEDPFIDDSELLWEEQRAATKDGFFVYFGPLIEKGHYASLERANGTMKRGGVKNK